MYLDRQMETRQGDWMLLPVTVEQISLQHGPTFLLAVSVGLRLVLVVSVAVVPGGSVRFPRPQTDPAEVRLAGLVLADHVIAAAVLLDGGVTLETIRGYLHNHVKDHITVGHSFVLAEIQLLVSLSSSHFLIHFLMR